MKRDELLEKAHKIISEQSFSAPRDKSVFWSGPGNLDRATHAHEQDGLSSIADTDGGKALDNLIPFKEYKNLGLSDDDYDQLWKIGSDKFSREQQGNAATYVCGAMEERDFRAIEMEKILSSDVSSINGMDIKNVIETYEISKVEAFKLICESELTRDRERVRQMGDSSAAVELHNDVVAREQLYDQWRQQRYAQEKAAEQEQDRQKVRDTPEPSQPDPLAERHTREHVEFNKAKEAARLALEEKLNQPGGQQVDPETVWKQFEDEWAFKEKAVVERMAKERELAQGPIIDPAELREQSRAQSRESGARGHGDDDNR